MATRACRRIEPDRIAGAPAARRIIGQHAGEALLRGALRRKVRPRRASSATKATAVGERLMRERARIRSARRARCAALKEMARVTMRPSISGSTTCIARSAAPRPRVRSAPLLERRRPASTTCSTGASSASSAAAQLVEARRKRRRVEHDVEAIGSSRKARSGASAASSLRLVTKTLVDARPLVARAPGPAPRSARDRRRDRSSDRRRSAPRRARPGVEAGGLEAAEGG